MPLRARDRDSRFVFGARAVDLLGRQEEIAALDQFLANSRSFCWWLVAGPGGQGKSRLALEFCLWRGVLWRAGFLADPHGADRRLTHLNALSWDLSPLNRAVFLVRAANDFPKEASIKASREPATATPKQRFFWSMADVNVVSDYGDAGDLAAARAMWDRLDAIAQNHPDEPVLRQRTDMPS